MYCRICNKFFKVKSSLKDLFKNKKAFLCPDCINRYKLRLKHIVVPLDKYNINFYILYEKMNLNYVALYANEYSEIIKKIMKSAGHVVIIDVFDDKKLELYEQIVKIFNGYVTFVSFLLKTL